MIQWDSRVGSKVAGHKASHAEVAAHLTELGAEVIPTSLPFGDFVLVGNGPDGAIRIGIELKEIGDFVTSMLSGRLADHQIPGLTDPANFERAYIVLQGFYRVRRGSGLLEVPRGNRWRPLRCGPRPIFWTDVEKFITGIEETGIRVRRTRTSQESARVIAQVLDGFWSKDYADHKSFNVLYRPAPLQLVREDPATRRLRSVAACLPGIGYGRSKVVAQHFRSIERLVLEGREVGAWEGLDGIGKKLAEGTVRAILEELPASTVPARSVSTRDRVPRRGPRHSRQRQNQQPHPGRRDQRSVSAAGAGHRVPRRSRAE